MALFSCSCHLDFATERMATRVLHKSSLADEEVDARFPSITLKRLSSIDGRTVRGSKGFVLRPRNDIKSSSHSVERFIVLLRQFAARQAHFRRP